MKTKIKSLFKKILSIDTSNPKKFARDLAFSSTISLWPMIGVRTILGGMGIWIFGYSQKIFWITNNFGFIPFLLLYFPHIRIGEWIFNAPRFLMSFADLWDYVALDPLGSVSSLLFTVGHAITGWVVLIPVYMLVFYSLAYWFAVYKNKKIK